MDDLDYKMLFAVSAALASVRDRDGLAAVIAERVPPIFGFSQGSDVRVYNDERNTLETFFTKTKDGEPRDGEMPTFCEPLAVEGFFQKIAATDEVVASNESRKASRKTVRIDEAAARIRRDPDCRCSLSVALRCSGKLVGTFHINFNERKSFTENELRLFKTISELIAVAVSKILADEEILERAREKTKLLSISREIAEVQTREQLLKVVFNKIRSIFPYDDAGLFYFCDADGKPNARGACHVHLLDDLISEVNFELTEKGITGVLCEGTDVIRFAATSQPRIMSLQELMRFAPRHRHFPVMQRLGIEHLPVELSDLATAFNGAFCDLASSSDTTPTPTTAAV